MRWEVSVGLPATEHRGNQSIPPVVPLRLVRFDSRHHRRTSMQGSYIHPVFGQSLQWFEVVPLPDLQSDNLRLLRSPPQDPPAGTGSHLPR